MSLSSRNPSLALVRVTGLFFVRFVPATVIDVRRHALLSTSRNHVLPLNAQSVYLVNLRLLILEESEMSVEALPAVAAEILFTRNEAMTFVYAEGELVSALTERYVTILFAYIASIYLAGSKLSRLQYLIANVMYCLIMGWMILIIAASSSSANSWLELAAIPSDNSITEVTNSARTAVMAFLLTSLVVLSVWFGASVRHSDDKPYVKS